MRTFMWFVGLILLVAAVACSSSDPLGTPSGNVHVFLTDAPLDLTGVSAVEVTIDEMILFAVDEEDDEGAVDLYMPGAVPGEGLTLNLLDFQDGVVTLLAMEEVLPGEYEKLRMLIAAANLVRDDDGDPETEDIVEPIFVPSGKVDVPLPFTVSGGEDVDIVIDFDAAASVQVNATPGRHQYILRPVITPVEVSKR